MWNFLIIPKILKKRYFLEKPTKYPDIMEKQTHHKTDT
jgi:hypothetical protein